MSRHHHLKKNKILELIHTGKLCPYCGGDTVVTDSAVVYDGVSYGPIHICFPCMAYCGCHRNTVDALGSIANDRTRKARKRAHGVFDLLWKHKHMTRKHAYFWMSAKMGVFTQYAHIGMLNESECNELVQHVTDYFENKKIKLIG